MHDLSAKPQLRRQLLLLAGQEVSADGALVLPRIQVGKSTLLTLSEVQDMEDHAELDPLLSAALREFAPKLS